MSESIVLDTPEQINAWVLLSRISQAHMHMAGYPVPGLLKWCKTNIPGCENARTVKQAYPRLLDYCDEFDVSAPGGEQCNYQILLTPKVLNGLYFDQGIVASLDDVSANEVWVEAYGDQRLVIMRTMDDVRGPDRNIQMVRDA